MPPPDPQPYVPEQGVDTSVPVQPAGYGAFQQTPATPPPPRNIVDYTVDTVLGMAQGAIQIPAAISGAASRVPGTSPEQQASVRDDQRYWNDMDYWLGRAKSKTGQAEDAAGGPDITKDPVHALVQGAAGIIPQAPLMMLGPFAPLAFGVQGVGDLANKIRAKIDDADHGELMKAPVYKQTFERTGDTEKAKEALYQSTNDLATNLIAGGGSAIGGGLLTHAIPKIGTKLLSEAMANKIVAGHNLKGRLGLGAAEGFGSGALMTGSSEYAQQQAEYEAGMGPPPDYGAIATHAAKSGAVLGVIGGASKGLWGTRPDRPAPAIGTDVESVATSMADEQLGPPAPMPQPGAPTPGGPEAPHMPVPSERPAPGYQDYEQHQPPPTGPTGPRPGVEEEAGDQMPAGQLVGQRYQVVNPELGVELPGLPGRTVPGVGGGQARRGTRGMQAADIAEPGTPEHEEIVTTALMSKLEDLKRRRAAGEDTLTQRQLDRLDDNITAARRELIQNNRDIKQARAARAADASMTEQGYGEAGSPAGPQKGSMRKMQPGDLGLLRPTVTEGGQPFEAPPVVTPERPIPPRFPEVESPRFPRQGDFPPPEEEPPREPPPAGPREPPAGGGGGAEAHRSVDQLSTAELHQELQQTQAAAEEAEHNWRRARRARNAEAMSRHAAEMERAADRADDLEDEIRKREGQPALPQEPRSEEGNVVGLHPPDLEPQLAEHDTPTLRAMLHEARLREQEAVDKWRRTHSSADGDAAERAADLADLLEDEVNERARVPEAAERRRREIVAEQRERGERHDDSIFGVRGEHVLSDLSVRPTRPRTPDAIAHLGDALLPRAANVNAPLRPTLHARGTLTPGRNAPRVGPERHVATTQGKQSRIATAVETRRIGRRGAAILETVRERRKQLEAEDREARQQQAEEEARLKREGSVQPRSAAEVRAARVPSIEARTEEARRAALAKEGLARRHAREWEARAIADLVDTLRTHQGERVADYRRTKQLARRMIDRFKEMTSFARDLVKAHNQLRLGQVPDVWRIEREGERLPLTKAQQETMAQRQSMYTRMEMQRIRAESGDEAKLTDRERKQRVRAQQYVMREIVAERAVRDPEAGLSVEQLNNIVARLLGRHVENLPRGKRGERLLAEALDPEHLPLVDRMRLFDSTVNELPLGDLRDIANQINNEAMARIIAGQKGYSELEDRMRETMGAPQIRLNVLDQGRRGVGPWHRRFGAYKQLIDRINTIVGSPKFGADGKPLFDKDGKPVRSLGSLDTVRNETQERAAIRRLRETIVDFYNDEIAVRAGDIRAVDRADRVALQAAKDQFRRAKENKGLTRDERANIDRADAEIDKLMAERWGEGEDERTGREVDEEGTPEQEMSQLFLQLDRAANPEDYQTEQEALRHGRNFRSMLNRFNSSIDQITVPDVLNAVRRLMDTLMPGIERDRQGQPVFDVSEGAEHVRNVRIKFIEDALDEVRKRNVVEAERRAASGSRRDADQMDRDIAGEEATRQYNLAQARRFGISHGEWIKLPPEFQQLSVEYNQLIRPQDMPTTQVANVGGGRPELMIPPRRQTTTSYPDQQLRLQAEERAARERDVLARSPSMTLGDLYLPFHEQLDFIRRVRGIGGEEPSEADLALRGQQLVDRAGRLRNALETIDPALWNDPGRGWAGEGLQQLHEEMRERAGELPEFPRKDAHGDAEPITPDIIHEDMARWSAELERVENEARLHYENLNPDVREMEYGIGQVLDSASDIRQGGNLPRGAHVSRVSDFARESPAYGVQTKSRMVRHFLDVANKLIGDLDVVHLTDEQMNMALQEVGLPPDTPSFYHRPSDRIIVRQSDMAGADRDRLLIHEMAHPIMEAAAQNPKLQAIVKRLDEQRQALRDAFENPEHPQHADVARLLDGNDHGLADVHEFFSELWSNPDFAKALHAVKTTSGQRDRWKTGSRESLLEATLKEIKRGLTGMFFQVSKQRLLNDSSVAALDLLQRMDDQGRRRPYIEGEPLARGSEGGNAVKGKFLHGSPFEFTDEPHGGVRGVVWVTKDPRVAREYAEGAMMGAQRGEGARKPNVRTIDVDAKNVFDMRKPEHRAIFEEIRQESRQHADPDEHVRSAQLTGEGLPSFGTVAEIEPYLRARGFDGMWANEGSQGNSLALFVKPPEPAARPAARRVGGSLPSRPAEGFVKDVWEGLTERGKDIAHYVNQEGGMTGMVMKVMNFADLARSADAGTKDDRMRGMQGRVQKVYDVGHETLQRKKEIMEQQDHKQFRALANELRVKSPGHLDAVLDYMDRENYVGAAGSSKLGEGENKWVGDREEPGNRQAHNEHPALERAWNALPESSRKMIKGLRDYYKGRYDAIREATLRDLVHLRGFVEGQHREATEVLMKHITDGRDALSSAETDLLKQHVRGYDGYDKPEADRTKDNKEFRDYLSQMRALPEFKKIAGVYYPMMRRGDYVVEGHAKLDRFAKPFGGEEQDREAGAPPTGHWLFPDKDAANQFVDRMSQDDAPFLKVQQAYETDDGKWRVDVNPMHLNFHSSLRKAREEHDRLRQDPDMDMYELQERRDYGKNAMNPAWATTLMKDMIESTKRTAAYRGLDDTTREILSRQWQDLAVRHLMSTSARSRYLPRSYTSGANKDALDNLMQYGNNTANTLAELEFRPQMRDAIADMDKYERDMRDSKDPELAKWGLRRSQIKNEVHNRLRMRNDHLASPIVTKVLQTVLKLSFLDKLMSPGFLLLNASEPWTIAAPMLAGEHGVKAYGEVAKAYNILGAGKVYGAGVADFIKVFKAGIHGDPQLADTLKLLTDKIKQTGFSDKHSTTAELVEMLENLQKHGYLDRNAGMELEQSLDPRATAAGRALNWMDNMFRQSNVAVENVNRGVAGIAGYRLARMAGKTHEEAMAKAQDIVDKSAGNYGFLNAPALFNHPHLKFAFQFKKYALRMTSNIVRVVAGAARGDPGAMGQLIAMAASQQVISGALGLPTEPLKAVITASNVLGINPYNTDDVERILNEYIAGKVGRDAKDAFLYGLPRLLGTGLGARTGWDTLWTYGTLGNKRDDMATAIGHLAGGAPGGLIAEWAQGSQDMAQGIASYMHGAHTQGQQSMVNGMRNLVPIKVLADAFPALQDYFTGRQKPTGQPFDFSPTVGDTIQRIGGIRTARDLAASQARSAFVRQRDVYNADRTRQLQGYAQASNPAERAAVRSHIMNQWNAGKPDVQRITYGDLQKAATAFERKGKLSPSDLGLAITARTRPFAPNPNVYGFMPSGAR
jgi:hypothetical protein